MSPSESRLPQFPVEGGCLCGAVRYRLDGPPLTVYRCHCKDCQRTSGSSHSMSMILRRETFELLSGKPTPYKKIADSGRAVNTMRCPDCGTIVWNERDGQRDIVVLRPGTLDDMDWAVPAGNIWTASKAAWFAIDPDELNYEGQAPSRDALYAAWAELVHA